MMKLVSSLDEFEITKSKYINRRIGHQYRGKKFEEKGSEKLFIDNTFALFELLQEFILYEDKQKQYFKNYEDESVEKGKPRIYFDGYNYYIFWLTELQSKFNKLNKYRIEYYVI